MDIHIGKIIEQKFQESGLKLPVFAERISTGERNVYSIFTRKDINASMLKKISEVLNYNFFSLYNLKIGDEQTDTPSNSRNRFTFNLNLSIDQKKIPEISVFLTEIIPLAAQHGITLI